MKELIDLVKTPEMRKRTLNVFFSWLAVAMVYYGLSFNTKNLGGNRYLSSFVSGFVEVNNKARQKVSYIWKIIGSRKFQFY